MQRTRSAFLPDWTVPLDEQFCYQDGIREAIRLLSLKHNLLWVTGGRDSTINCQSYNLHLVNNEQKMLTLVDSFNPDVLLCWGSLDRPWHRSLHERFPKLPKVLCFAGGPTDHVAKSYFNVIVVESQKYLDEFTKIGVAAMRGFGTNTKVFKYLKRPKVWDAIYPASLCFHKNIELFCKSTNERGLCVGNHNEPTLVSKVLQLHTHLLSRVDSYALTHLYNMSRVTLITAGPDGGAQRVVLESMSCGTPVIVMSDNDKCVEFVESSGFGKVTHAIEEDIRDCLQGLISAKLDPFLGINYVRKHWSENHYADSIESALLKSMEN